MKTKKKSFFKRPAAVIAAAAVVVLGAGTAFAAVNGFWSKGMSGILPEDTASQQALESQGYVTHFDEDYNAVTIDGVTITPADVICDGTYGHIVFSVEGFDIEDGEEPQFGRLEVYTGNDYDTDGVSAGGEFYPGYTIDITESGLDHYDNGDPMEWKDEDHILYKPRYTGEDGHMEYIVYFHGTPNGESLTGKTAHIEFDGLGVSTGKAEMEVTVSGKWEFDITLPGSDNTRVINVGQKVEGSDYILDTVEISPLSVKAYFIYDGAGESGNDADMIPWISEVYMVDGSYWVPTGGGSYGFNDGTNTKGYDFIGFGKVLDAASITSIKFSCNPNPGESTVTIIELD